MGNDINLDIGANTLFTGKIVLKNTKNIAGTGTPYIVVDSLTKGVSYGKGTPTGDVTPYDVVTLYVPKK